MSRHPLDRAALLLGLVGLLSPIFSLTTSSNNNFVPVQGLGLAVIPVLGALAILGAVMGNRIVILVAGGLCLAAALLQLAQFGRDPNWLEGNGSTFALLLALGIGLSVVGLAPRTISSQTR